MDRDQQLSKETLNYRTPLMFLEGATVREGGPLTTPEQSGRMAAYFRLDRDRWHALALRLELTEAEAAAILKAASYGESVWNDLAPYEPSVSFVF